MTCLQPVQVADRHTDVGGVGALAPAPVQQATLTQPIKHERRQPLSLAIGEQPRAELGEHRGIEARVTKVEADAAEPPPRDRVADFSAQALVAEPVAVLEVQQPQQRVDRDRGTAPPG